jgi:high-affinity nickel-transport protein
MLTAILLGLALGVRHATDPDHVAAVAALVARHGCVGVAARIAAAWGVGHGAAILAIGGVLVALRIVVEPSFVVAAELVVAALLIVLGVANLRALGRPQDAHPFPEHVHDHGAASRSNRRAFGIGVAHGLGGSAAVALLALAAMPDLASQLVYLAVFGAGTVGGMVVLSTLLGLPLLAVRGRPLVSRIVLGASGALSLAVGLHLAYGIGASALAL